MKRCNKAAKYHSSHFTVREGMKESVCVDVQCERAYWRDELVDMIVRVSVFVFVCVWVSVRQFLTFTQM